MNDLNTNEIIPHPEKYIKWMCYNIFISIDNKVFNLSFKPLKEQLIGGSYCYYVDGRYRRGIRSATLSTE
jgi:hypothetical protein